MSRTLTPEAAGLNILVLVSPKRECARLALRLTAGLPHSCVVSASRMQEAVSALKTRRMHAIVCDLRFFPKMYAAMAHQSAGDRIVPIIVLASEGAEAQVAAALQQGAASFLVKAEDYGRVLPLVVERVAQVLSSWAEVGQLVRHEMNNPLTGILGNAELILASDHELPDEVRSRVTTIVRLAVRLRDLVKSLEERLQGRHTPPETASDESSNPQVVPLSAGPRRS